jgi:hypothetical protein
MLSADRREGRERQRESRQLGSPYRILWGIGANGPSALRGYFETRNLFTDGTRPRRWRQLLKKSANCRNKMRPLVVFLRSRIPEIKYALG